MRMEKRTFRIGELAQALSSDKLTIEPSVIRFWEKEFHLKPRRTTTGQRHYSEEDLATFSKIKLLLYEKKFTIAGAKNLFRQPTQAPGLTGAEVAKIQQPELVKKLCYLKEKLEKIKQLL